MISTSFGNIQLSPFSQVKVLNSSSRSTNTSLERAELTPGKFATRTTPRFTSPTRTFRATWSQSQERNSMWIMPWQRSEGQFLVFGSEQLRGQDSTKVAQYNQWLELFESWFTLSWMTVEGKLFCSIEQKRVNKSFYFPFYILFNFLQ